MSPIVSVVIPVHNRSNTIADSMKSVLSQSYTDLELIVVDDASTEDLEPIVTGVGDPRIRYIRREKNGGAGAARNTGIQAATGQFIAFHDSDDLWLPGKLENQMKALEEAGPEVGVITGAKVLYGSGPIGVYGVSQVSMRPPPAGLLKPDEDQVRKFLVENRISLQNALFRKDCYPSDVWFDEVLRANEDWAFAAKLAQHTKIIESPHPVVMAFSSPDGISKRTKAKAIALVRIFKQNREQFEKYPQVCGTMYWQIGRFLSRFGKKKMARRFYLAGLVRDPGFPLRAIRERLAKRKPV